MMLDKGNIYCNRRNRSTARFVREIAVACLAMLFAQGLAVAQEKLPITTQGTQNAIKAAANASPKYRATLMNRLAQSVRQRGVNYRLTPEMESEYRKAGATEAVLAAIRAGYREPAKAPDRCAPVPAGAPLTSDSIITMLQAGTKSNCVEEFVKVRGVGFSFSTNLANQLSASGASDSLVGLIGRKAPAPLPAPSPAEISHTRIENPPPGNRAPSGNPVMHTNTFLVENGQQIKIRLTSRISTRTDREGTKFTAVALDPGLYAGSLIEGHIAKLKRSGSASGKTELELAFDSIQFSDGRKGYFAAQVEKVYQSETVKAIDEEGNVKSGSKTKETAARGAGGAALGALLGGILGGPKGAAIGAAIGVGAGVSSSTIQGGKELLLDPGTELLVRASSPNSRPRR